MLFTRYLLINSLVTYKIGLILEIRLYNTILSLKLRKSILFLIQNNINFSRSFAGLEINCEKLEK